MQLPTDGSYEGELASSILLEEGDAPSRPELPGLRNPLLEPCPPFFTSGLGGLDEGRGRAPYQRIEEPPHRTPTRTPSPVYQYGGGVIKSFGEADGIGLPPAKSAPAPLGTPQRIPEGSAPAPGPSGSSGGFSSYAPMQTLWQGLNQPPQYYNMLVGNPAAPGQPSAPARPSEPSSKSVTQVPQVPVDANMLSMMMMQAQQQQQQQPTQPQPPQQQPQPLQPQQSAPQPAAPGPGPNAFAPIAPLMPSGPSTSPPSAPPPAPPVPRKPERPERESKENVLSPSQALPPGPQPPRPQPVAPELKKAKGRRDKEPKHAPQPQQHEPGAIAPGSASLNRASDKGGTACASISKSASHVDLPGPEAVKVIDEGGVRDTLRQLNEQSFDLLKGVSGSFPLHHNIKLTKPILQVPGDDRAASKLRPQATSPLIEHLKAHLLGGLKGSPRGSIFLFHHPYVSPSKGTINFGKPL